MEIKNYIWDFDGTLYDSYPAMVEGAAKALQDFGIIKDPRDLPNNEEIFYPSA